MQGSRGKLHPHLIGEFIQRHQVRRILVLYRHAKPHILHPHLAQFLQGIITTTETIVQATDFIVGLFQPFNGNADTYLRELLAKFDDAVREKAVGRDDDTVTLLIQFTYHLLQVCTDKRLPSGDIREIHLRKLLNRLDRNFLFRLRRSLIAVTHRATRIAPVRHDDRTVQFLFCHNVI